MKAQFPCKHLIQRLLLSDQLQPLTPQWLQTLMPQKVQNKPQSMHQQLHHHAKIVKTFLHPKDAVKRTGVEMTGMLILAKMQPNRVTFPISGLLVPVGGFVTWPWKDSALLSMIQVIAQALGWRMWRTCWIQVTKLQLRSVNVQSLPNVIFICPFRWPKKSSMAFPAQNTYLEEIFLQLFDFWNQHYTDTTGIMRRCSTWQTTCTTFRTYFLHLMKHG